MFKHTNKRQKEENSVVDYIIQTSTDKQGVEERLLGYINEHVHNKAAKEEILTSLEEYDMELCKHPVFNRFKKRLFGTSKINAT